MNAVTSVEDPTTEWLVLSMHTLDTERKQAQKVQKVESKLAAYVDVCCVDPAGNNVLRLLLLLLLLLVRLVRLLTLSAFFYLLASLPTPTLPSCRRSNSSCLPHCR